MCNYVSCLDLCRAYYVRYGDKASALEALYNCASEYGVEIAYPSPHFLRSQKVTMTQRHSGGNVQFGIAAGGVAGSKDEELWGEDDA